MVYGLMYIPMYIPMFMPVFMLAFLHFVIVSYVICLLSLIFESYIISYDLQICNQVGVGW